VWDALFSPSPSPQAVGQVKQGLQEDIDFQQGEGGYKFEIEMGDNFEQGMERGRLSA
jgi:hypothetical protein